MLKNTFFEQNNDSKNSSSSKTLDFEAFLKSLLNASYKFAGKYDRGGTLWRTRRRFPKSDSLATHKTDKKNYWITLKCTYESQNDSHKRKIIKIINKNKRR